MLCENVRLRTHLYYRIAEDDPPNHFARPPCTLKTWWSLAPPNHDPPPAGRGDAGAVFLSALRRQLKGGDG